MDTETINLTYGDRLQAILIINGKPYISEVDHQDCLEMYYQDGGIKSEFDWQSGSIDEVQKEAEHKTFAMKNDHEAYGFDIFDYEDDYVLIAHDKESLLENFEWAKKYAEEDEMKVAYFSQGYEAELLKGDLDKLMDNVNLIEAGDWHIDEKEFNDFINHKLDSFFDNEVELEFHGNVTFGNDRFGFTLQHKQGDEIYLLYSQTTPADKYQSKAEKEERFNFNFGSENFEDPATYEKTKYESSIFKTIPVDEIGKSLTELKVFVSNYFVEQQLISPQYAPQYKAIRENGTNFFMQRQEALGNYFQNLLKQPKLSPKELSDLAVYYDNKVYKNLAATGQEDMENAVKWMLQDGLKPSQISIIGTEMISCDPLDQDLVKKVLKSPEIKQFQEELKTKAMATTKAK